MIPWLLNLGWLLVLVVASPWLAWRSLVRRKRFGDWRQKLFGRIAPRTSATPALWFHAVSVGEVLQLPRLIVELGRTWGEFEVIISTTTATGHDLARQRFPDARVVYWPLDFSWAVETALQRLRPAGVVLVELELWPNFLRAAERRGVPVLLVNGRITARSHRGYRRVRPLVASMLRRVNRLIVQSHEYADRFIDLGAPPDRLHVCGSLKYDGVETDRDNPRTQGFRQLLGLTEGGPVLVAGSTHDPEERLVAEAWRHCRSIVPGLRLVLAPRHAERFDEVARLLSDELGMSVLRRSGLQSGAALPAEPDRIILLDSLGELGACWGLADVAYVGGSLSPRGGQSMIEPAAFGAALLFGPNTWNFSEFVDLLRRDQAARIVDSGEELVTALTELLTDSLSAARMGRRARELVRECQGSTAETARLLAACLQGTPVVHASPPFVGQTAG
ncbi:MAG: 3-deoxy-D-manno-octulosonic acid transferase [Planctomycetaceae bacterium]